MISIGSVLKGPELRGSHTDRILTEIAKAAMECRGAFEFGASPAVNVVFYVPGSLGSPDWEGVRDGKYSRKQQVLMVQVAVPSHLMGAASLKAHLLESLHGANAVCFELFCQKGLRFPLQEAEALVERIKERVTRSSGEEKEMGRGS